jgi:hypothetical protein
MPVVNGYKREPSVLPTIHEAIVGANFWVSGDITFSADGQTRKVAAGK